MNREFGRIITFLRKEKKLSQKQVSADLGISQALLSHYEKGIRECGLSFLVKTADYYDVSVDYLLGRTPNPTGVKTEAEDIPEIEEVKDVNMAKSNTYCLLNRKLIVNSTAIIYSLLAEINNKNLSKYVTDYLTVAEYNVFREIYSLKENNPPDMFTVPESSADDYCTAAIAVNKAEINRLKKDSRVEGIDLCEDILAQKYSESYSSLHNLIKNAEKSLSQKFKI